MIYRSVLALALLATAATANAGIVPLTPVQEADWSRSFDAPGWSMCPANTAITGLYRSNTPWIYGVEKVRCAGASGSTTRNASAVASWQTSFDSQGWSLCPQNKFIIGLYRSSGHYLYNIEYPNCAELSVPGSTTTSLQWASCQSVRVDWTKDNTWIGCPAGQMVVGIYRGVPHFLDSILYLTCCSAWAP